MPQYTTPGRRCMRLKREPKKGAGMRPRETVLKRRKEDCWCQHFGSVEDLLGRNASGTAYPPDTSRVEPLTDVVPPVVEVGDNDVVSATLKIVLAEGQLICTVVRVASQNCALADTTDNEILSRNKLD